MIAYGTEHLSVDVFDSTYHVARPGDQIIYAIGDLALSRSIVPDGKELNALAKRTMHLAEQGRICLTQRAMPELEYRNGGGRCFEYIATKCQLKTLAATRSPRSSSHVGALAKA